MMTKRSYQLVRELSLTRQPVILEMLARRLGVSPRTVRTELDTLKGWLSSGSQLSRKPGVGITLTLSEEDHRRVLQETMSEKVLQPFSSSDRQRFIFLKLLQNDHGFQTMQQFADALYVSRIAVNKDLEEVEKLLSGYNLKLVRKPHYGIEVEGSEENWRKAVADYLVRLVDEDVLFDLLNQNMEHTLLNSSNSSRIDPISYRQIRSLFPEYVRIVREILEQTELERGIYFTDDNFVSLLIHLVIGLERIKQNKGLTMPETQLANLRKQSEFELTSQIAHKLEKALNIEVPEAEIGYMALHILGAKVEHGALDVKLDLRDFEPELILLAEGMIKVAEEAIKVKLTADQQLLLGLLLHLRPVINRLKYGMSLRNPILQQIKEQYPTIFGAAWISGAYLEKELGVKVGEEEIGYLAMHLGASVERQKHPKRVLVVCSSGVGTAQLLASRLRKLSPALEVVDMVSALRIRESCLSHAGKIDAIVTTVPLAENLGYPMIRVSPLLTDLDQQRLLEFLSLEQVIISETGQPLDKPSNLAERPELSWFTEKLIINKAPWTSRQAALEALGDLIECNGKADAGFAKSVVHREKLSSTAVGYGIAIPHGNTSYVQESVIAVALLQEPVDWEGEQVDLIFMLALKAEEAKFASIFFKHFYEALDNPDWVRKLKRCQTPKEMTEYLSQNSIR